MRHKPNGGKMPYLSMLKNSSKKFSDLGQNADDLQNVISFPCKKTSLVKYSWRPDR